MNFDSLLFITVNSYLTQLSTDIFFYYQRHLSNNTSLLVNLSKLILKGQLKLALRLQPLTTQCGRLECIECHILKRYTVNTGA